MIPDHPVLDYSRIVRMLRLELTRLQLKELRRVGQDPKEFLRQMAYRQEPCLGSLYPYCQVFYPDHGFAGTERGLGIVFFDLK